MSITAEKGFELSGHSSPVRGYLRDLWRSRDLIRMLARKDFFVRYRRASFGFIWVIALPLIQALVIAFIFERIGRFSIPSQPGQASVKFAVYMFCGIIPWSFFTSSMTSATGSIVDGADLATKVYFPRAALPIVQIVSGIRGYIPTVGVLIVLALALGTPLDAHILLLIPGTLLMLGLSLGFGMLFAASYVYFRDMRYVVAASIFPWFWASGTIFPLSRLCGAKLTDCTTLRILEFNPAVGMLQLYRAAIGAAPPGWGRPAIISAVWVVVLLACALPLYLRHDRVFLDLL